MSNKKLSSIFGNAVWKVEEDGSLSTSKASILVLSILSFFGGLTYGYNVAVAAPLDALIAHFRLGTFQAEIVSGGATLGALMIMSITGWLCDRFGRRPVLLVGSVATIVSQLALAASTSTLQLCLFRLTTGFGNGIMILATPMYTSELASASRQGSAVVLFQVGVCFGVFLPFTIIFLGGPLAWHAVFSVGAIPGIVTFLALLLFLPKSPCWLWQRGRDTTASRSENSSVENNSTGLMAPFLLGPGDTLVDSTGGGGGGGGGGSGTTTTICAALCTSPQLRRLVALGTVLALSNNSSDPAVFYGPQLLQLAGFPAHSSVALGMGLSFVNIVAVALAIALVDRFPRRTLLLTGLAVCATTYLAMALAFLLPALQPLRGAIVVLAFALFLLAFQLGPGSLFVVILPELYPPAHRGQCVGVNTFAMSAISLAINGSLLSLFRALGAGAVFSLCCALCLTCALVLWRYLPETKPAEAAEAGCRDERGGGGNVP